MTHDRRRFLTAAAAVSLLIASPAGAQSLFDRGKDMLKGLGGGSGGSSGVGGGLAVGEIAAGLKEALRVGSDRVVGTLGVKDGFNSRSDVHIPLPGTLKKVQSALKRVGMSDMADDLELRMNRAAEAAVPKAKSLFWNAIEQMTLDDAKRILDGPDNAATEYFRGKMSPPLARDMRPIVDNELSSVGAVQAYDRMMGQYKQIPFVPDAKADLTEHVLEKAIDGVFLYLGREEAAIRNNPAKRTTQLLQKVFG